MTRKRKRLIAVLVGLAIAASGVGIILSALEDNLVFFYTPRELTESIKASPRPIRIGGLVEVGSVSTSQAGALTFTVTDETKTARVSFTGLVPSLFREGQGVVAEGRFDESGTFIATSILAKHDENYMPPQVIEALEESGQWKGDITETPKPYGLEEAPTAP